MGDEGCVCTRVGEGVGRVHGTSRDIDGGLCTNGGNGVKETYSVIGSF